MRLVLFKTLWGCDPGSSYESHLALFERIKVRVAFSRRGRAVRGQRWWERVARRVQSDGFAGIEAALGGLPVAQDEIFAHALRASGLRLIVQVHTCTYKEREYATEKDLGVYPQGYVPDRTVAGHVSSLAAGVARAKALGAELVNVHGGHDSWDVDTAVEYLEKALAVGASAGMPLVHETHRRRVLWNPFQALELLRRVPALQINADLSHWCCACERIFDETSDPDWWPALLEQVAARCRLIHARVGHAQGPQVAHPAARELQFEMEEHLRWWMRILDAAEARGDAEFRVEPEFGVSGYQRLEPFSCKPVEDLWEINSYVAARVLQTFRAADPARALATPVPAPLRRVLDAADARARAARRDSPAQPLDSFAPLLLAFLAGAAVASAAFLIPRRT